MTGQRTRWTQNPQTGPYVEVSQEKAIEELEVIPVDLQRTLAKHTMYRSFLGQLNWLQSGTQFKVATSSLDVLQKQLLQQLVM